MFMHGDDSLKNRRPRHYTSWRGKKREKCLGTVPTTLSFLSRRQLAGVSEPAFFMINLSSFAQRLLLLSAMSTALSGQDVAPPIVNQVKTSGAIDISSGEWDNVINLVSGGGERQQDTPRSLLWLQRWDATDRQN